MSAHVPTLSNLHRDRGFPICIFQEVISVPVCLSQTLSQTGVDIKGTSTVTAAEGNTPLKHPHAVSEEHSPFLLSQLGYFAFIDE